MRVDGIEQATSRCRAKGQNQVFERWKEAQRSNPIPHLDLKKHKPREVKRLTLKSHGHKEVAELTSALSCFHLTILSHCRGKIQSVLPRVLTSVCSPSLPSSVLFSFSFLTSHCSTPSSLLFSLFLSPKPMRTRAARHLKYLVLACSSAPPEPSPLLP